MHDWPARHASTATELQAKLAAERAALPFIELRDGEGVQRLVPLPDEGLTIGRTPASGLALTWDAQVSRSHASIEQIDGIWTVLDDGRSTNGTFVNEERVQGRRPLRHLDVVRTGATRVRFHDPGNAHDKLTEVAADAVAPPLTAAQRRVLVALCSRTDGPASNEEIAAELHVSIDTVKSHMRALFDAFGWYGPPLSQALRAVRLAVDAGPSSA